MWQIYYKKKYKKTNINKLQQEPEQKKKLITKVQKLVKYPKPNRPQPKEKHKHPNTQPTRKK